MALTGVAYKLYAYIIVKETLEEQQSEYQRLMSVPVYNRLYKDKIDAELIANGYSDVIVEITV